MAARPLQKENGVVTSAMRPEPGKAPAMVRIGPLAAASKLRTFSSHVRRNVNWIIIVIGVTSLLIFMGIMTAILVITIRSKSGEDKKTTRKQPHGDHCFHRNRSCYIPSCHNPYAITKDTTVDGKPCMTVLPPSLRDYLNGTCFKGEDYSIPWCYITSTPPFKRRPCYRFCDEADCLDKERGCYKGDLRECKGQKYAYKEEYSSYPESTWNFDETTKCSPTDRYLSSCILSNAMAPFCHNSNGSIRFCYPSCKALKYLQDHRLEITAHEHHNYGRVIDVDRYVKPINSFYGINRKACILLCNRTEGCYFYSWKIGNIIDGLCRIFGTHTFRLRRQHNGTYGWFIKNDTIILYGGKQSFWTNNSMRFPRRISTLRIQGGKTMWDCLGTQSRVKKQINPATTSTRGRFYALTWSAGRHKRFIEEYDERGLKRALYDDFTQGIRYAAVVGVDNGLFMCGGLNSSNGKVGSDALQHCVLFEVPSLDNSKSPFHLNKRKKTFRDAPSAMLLPRVHFFLVHFGDLIFAFMGCQKPVEDCTEMVKPIHYYVIKDDKWNDTGTSMQIERINYGYATYKDKVYVCGGLNPKDKSEVLDSCEAYQLSSSQSGTRGSTVQTKGLPAKTQQLAMAVVGDLLLAIGGRHSTDETNVSRAIYRYDDSDDSWKLFSYMNRSRYGMGVAVI